MRQTFVGFCLGLGLLIGYSLSLVADEPQAQKTPPQPKENPPALLPKQDPAPKAKSAPPARLFFSRRKLEAIVKEVTARTTPVEAKAAHLPPLPAGARIDLEYIPESWYVRKNAIVIAERLSIAQTMTMKSSGTIVRVAMPLRVSRPRLPDHPIVVDIRRVKDGKPVEDNVGDEVLTKANLAHSYISNELEWVAVDLPPVHVDKGEQLALVLSTESVPEYHWGGDTDWILFQEPAGIYDGGRAFTRGKSAGRAPADDTIRERWGDLYLLNNIRSPTGGGEKVDFGFRLWLTPDEAK